MGVGFSRSEGAIAESDLRKLTVDVTPSGLLATAGGLIFSGNRAGYFMALDSRTGKPLWKFRTGGVVIAPPITYLLNGSSVARGQAYSITLSAADVDGNLSNIDVN